MKINKHMTNYIEEIDSILHKAVTEKTFTLEIVEQIKELRKLPELVTEQNTKILELEKKNSDQHNIIAKLELDEANIKAREKAVAEKERAIELKEIEFKWKDNLLNEYKNVMTLVFRNQTIRQNKFGSVPVEVNGYVQSQSINETTETTID
jgi:predicted RNase H-like nuclease (RuvC/YqgF family)